MRVSMLINQGLSGSGSVLFLKDFSKILSLLPISLTAWRFILSAIIDVLVLLLPLPVGHGGVLNSPGFYIFSVSKVRPPLMGDATDQYLESTMLKLNF